MKKKIIKLQIWDTYGQELYRSLITNFYSNTFLAIIVYAINNRQSFNNIDMWLKELRKHASPAVKVILIELERGVLTEIIKKMLLISKYDIKNFD